MTQQSLLDETAAPLVPPRPTPKKLHLVCLGATAAQALIDRKFRVTQLRGRPVESDLAPVVIATVHPSSILRADDRDAELAAFVRDLRVVAEHIAASHGA